jgi:hypothetical protein
MPDAYTVRLTGRQEGLEYRTASAVYRFDVLLADGEWQLYLPCSKGEDYAPHELTEAEAAEILPRLVAHLRHDRILGVPVWTRPVRVHRRPAP